MESRSRQSRADTACLGWNADEGYRIAKDRLLLRQHAYYFEGMTVAADHGIAATQRFVYLRGEYRYLLEALRADARAAQAGRTARQRDLRP